MQHGGNLTRNYESSVLVQWPITTDIRARTSRSYTHRPIPLSDSHSWPEKLLSYMFLLPFYSLLSGILVS